MRQLSLVPALAALLAAGAAAAAPAMKASALIGLPVLERATGASGRIDELVVDLANNRVHYAVIDFDRRKVAYPLQALDFGAGLDRAAIGPGKPAPVSPRADMTLARGSTLIGWTFESRAGIDLGRVVDFVVEPGTGAVPFSLVRLAGGKAMRGVPLGAFSLLAGRTDLVTDLAREDLEMAPSFSERGLAEGLADPQFVERHADVARRLAASPLAAAGETRAGEKQALFARMDRNGDGVLDDAELDRGAAGQRNWIAIDLNRDGLIGRDEFTALGQE